MNFLLPWYYCGKVGFPSKVRNRKLEFTEQSRSRETPVWSGSWKLIGILPERVAALIHFGFVMIESQSGVAPADRIQWRHVIKLAGMGLQRL